MIKWEYLASSPIKSLEISLEPNQEKSTDLHRRLGRVRRRRRAAPPLGRRRPPSRNLQTRRIRCPRRRRAGVWAVFKKKTNLYLNAKRTSLKKKTKKGKPEHGRISAVKPLQIPCGFTCARTVACDAKASASTSSHTCLITGDLSSIRLLLRSWPPTLCGRKQQQERLGERHWNRKKFGCNYVAVIIFALALCTTRANNLNHQSL